MLATHLDTAKALGARIAYYRKQKELTQFELAQLIFVSRSTLAHYECGYCCPNAVTLMIIARTLNISLSKFDITT